MALYFQDFPSLEYRFGNETFSTNFQNIAAYVDVIDTVKDNLSYYTNYEILDGDRPDVMSMKLYGDMTYYFTFFLMNDHLRESGWPMTAKELIKKVKKDFPNTTITTLDSLSGKMKVGQTITGNNSGASGRILKRRLDLGQIVVATTQPFTNGETCSVDTGLGFETITITTSQEEYLSTHHYEDTSGYVDITPSVGPGGTITPITFFDHYTLENDKLRPIRVIKPESISSLYSAFKQAMVS